MLKNVDTFAPMAATDALRVVTSRTGKIDARPDAIFPLLCPVMEYNWIPGWDCRLVYTQSGLNENHCMFYEDMSGAVLLEKPLPALWITSRHDPENRHVHFVVILGDEAVVEFDVTVRDAEASGSAIHWDAVFTALTEDVGRLGPAVVEQRLQAALGFLYDTLRHYCETGQILQ